MTVASEVNRSGPYIGNGVTTIFNYGFRILDAHHIKVIRTAAGIETVLVIDADYIVSGVGTTGGGQVALTAAPTAAQTITILRNAPFTQETDLENQGPYFAETIEASLDLAAMRDQQLSERLDRADSASTAADRQATAIDRAAVAAVGAAVAADRVQTGLDRVQTGLDRTAVSTDKATVNTYKTDAATSAAAAAASAAAATGNMLLFPSGRLSLSSTAAIPTSDLTGAAAATLYYVDCGGGYVPVWDATANSWKLRSFTGALQLALDANVAHTLYHAANNVFDVYAYWDAALGSLRIGTTNAAANDFSNRTLGNISDIVQKNGIWVNTINGYLRVNNTGNVAGTDYILPGVNQSTYLGSIGTVAAGQGEDSVARRLVFNAYNGKRRYGFKKFTGAAYNYSVAAYRQVNADATLQVETLLGVPGIFVEAHAQHIATSTVAPAFFLTGIADSAGTLYPATEMFGSYGRVTDTTGGGSASADWSGYPGLGRKVFKWMEYGSASGTTQWQTNSDILRNGINVTVAEM